MIRAKRRENQKWSEEKVQIKEKKEKKEWGGGSWSRVQRLQVRPWSTDEQNHRRKHFWEKEKYHRAVLFTAGRAANLAGPIKRLLPGRGVGRKRRLAGKPCRKSAIGASRLV